jgi:hypothetical protein
MGRLDDVVRNKLEALLEEQVDDRISKFVWLRRASAGSNSAAMNRLLDRLEIIKSLDLSPDITDGISTPDNTAAKRRRSPLYRNSPGINRGTKAVHYRRVHYPVAGYFHRCRG